ncbi:hypothetical protein C1646_752093 [Rhizophagus diaphanus]|nr:hypothetical protein C1646_752093 [Rhizophagus diaphanus] [Rhizophagus sp. MUCL 43196]
MSHKYYDTRIVSITGSTSMQRPFSRGFLNIKTLTAGNYIIDLPKLERESNDVVEYKRYIRARFEIYCNFRNMNLLEIVGKPVDSAYCFIKIGGTAIVTTGSKDIDLSSVKANVRLNIDTSASISSDGVEAKVVGLGFKSRKSNRVQYTFRRV